MAYVLAPYEREVGSSRPLRRCALARVLPGQTPGGPEPFVESEGLGGYAVALILDPAHVATARRASGVFAFPDIPLTSKLGEATSASGRRLIRDALTAQGWRPDAVRTIPGVGKDGGLEGVSLLRLLEFMCSTRLKPRKTDTGEIVLDGPPQRTRPLPLPPVAGGAFPTTPVLDSATRDDESPATGWTDNVDGSSYGGLKIVSNKLAPISTDSFDYWSASTYGPDSEVYATDPDVADRIELYLRLDPIGSASVDGYFYDRVDASILRIYRLDNDAGTQLGADFSQAFTAADSWGGESIGSTHTLYYRSGVGAWTALGNRSDATYSAAGYLGVYAFGSTARFTQFGGGTVQEGRNAIPSPAGVVGTRGTPGSAGAGSGRS